MLYFILSIFSFIALPLITGGLIRKIRARVQGRKGPPVLQNIFDVLRLFGKEPVDGPNSGFFAEVAPVTAFVSSVFLWSLICFEWGSFILIPAFLLLQRISTMTFGMETGTSFGGLGAKREILLTITSEPIVFLMILVAQSHMQVEFTFTAAVMGILFLTSSGIAIMAELAKPPFDDPRTHLELTMVHEAMILEASGRSLAFFELASQVKIAALLTFIVKLGINHSKLATMKLISNFDEIGLVFAGTIITSVIVGYWEGISVRRKWVWVPEIMGLTFLFILLLGTLVKLN